MKILCTQPKTISFNDYGIVCLLLLTLHFACFSFVLLKYLKRNPTHHPVSLTHLLLIQSKSLKEVKDIVSQVQCHYLT